MIRTFRPEVLLLAIPLVLTLACSAGMNRSQVKSTLARVPELKAMGAEIDPLETVQVDGDHAVATANVLLTFQLERKSGRWEAVEIRTGDKEWVELGRLRQALADFRRNDTEAGMLEVARGLAAYFHQNGRFPEPTDLSQLTDVLYPAFLSRPVGLDAWKSGLRYRPRDKGARYRLISAGPDREFGTDDDLVLEDGRFSTRETGAGDEDK